MSGQNSLSFNIREAYRTVSFDYVGARWEFDSHLSIEDIFNIQNFVQASITATEMEFGKIRANVMAQDKDIIQNPSNKRIEYQKQAVKFLFDKVKHDKLVMTNSIKNMDGEIINQELLKTLDYEEYPLLFGMYAELAAYIVQWTQKQSQKLKKK